MDSVRERRFDSDSRSIFGHVSRACLALLLGAMTIGTVGCGGRTGGGAALGGTAEGGTAPPETKPSGRGTLVVTVTDALGTPVAGADVRVNTYWSDEDRRVVADVDGRAEIPGVIASNVSVTVYGPDLYEQTKSQSLSAGGTLKINITALPTAASTGGIVRAWVPDGGVSSDGQTLVFSVQIVQVPDAGGEYWAWGTDAVRVLACAPDAGNDVPRVRPDCVSGADGYDAAYEVSATGAAESVKTNEAVGPSTHAASYASALLLDQGSNVLLNDPADKRLYAAKYFLTYSSEKEPKVLAAFASDDPITGQPSLLPRKPVSVFPLDQPGYTTDGRNLFATVDSLAELAGGAAPLYSALDSMLDFVATHPQLEHNAVVVLTNGRDDTCGSRAACQSLRDALVKKSKDTGVAIVTVGMADAAGDADHETLGLLAQGAPHGGAFWAHSPKQLATILGNLHSYFADYKATLDATFRIQSPVPGAFASGRTVLGQVRLEVCPFDCNYTYIPFAVRIP